MTRSENERAERFLELLDAHRNVFEKIARAYCRRAADRDDLIADITAALWKSFRRYDPNYSFSTWAYRIALNVAISYERVARRRSARDAAAATERAGTAPLSESDAEPGERVERLHAFIAALPDLDKALVLLDLDDHPYETIAAILGLSETNVATKLGRLKARARDALLVSTATLWRQYDAWLEQSLRLESLVVTRSALVHSETALGRLRTSLALEILVNAVAVLAIGGFGADFFHELPAFSAAVALDAYALTILSGSVVQLVLVARIDYEEPVFALARTFERVKLARARITLWTLVLAPLMWVPLAVVTVRAFGGIDPVAAFGLPWLAANLAFGCALLLGAAFVARRYGGHATAPWLRRFLDTFAGRNARAAAAALDTVVRYGTDDAPAHSA